MDTEIKAIKQTLKLNSKHTLPILKCMQHKDGKLRATDLTIMVEINTPIIPDGIWNDTALEFGFREETKNNEFTVEDFPEIDLKLADKEMELAEDDMSKILRAYEFVSTDHTRPVLTGVVLKEGNVYATDGYKMYRNKTSLDKDMEINLPPELLKVLKSIKADKRNWTLSTYEESEQVALKSGNITIYSKTIYGTTPNYDMLIKNDMYDFTFDINLKKLKLGQNQLCIPENETAVFYNIVENKYTTVGEKIRLSDTVYRESGKLEYSEERYIVMPLASGNKNDVYVDTALLKPFAKNTIKVYVMADKKLEVKIIK